MSFLDMAIVGLVPRYRGSPMTTCMDMACPSLHQAVSLFMKTSYEVSAQVALRERFTNREKDGIQEPGSVPTS